MSNSFNSYPTLTREIDFSNVKVFITGGSGGIGSVICDTFSKYGASVDAPTSKELNLLDAKSVENYLSSMSEYPSIFIHSAGLNKLSGISEIDDKTLQDVFNVNVFSFMRILKHIVPEMQKNKYGRIIGISSLYGIVARERRVPYSASKHAISGIIKSVALEVANNNILINAVAPGYVMTDMTRNNLSEAEIEALKKEIPTHRLQTAKEIASLCLFLCSQYNMSITGQIIPVDGGFLCK